MQIRPTVEAFLIYAAILTCLSSLVMHLCGYKRLSSAVFLAAAVVVCIAFLRHTIIIAQIPLRGMYEVFLVLSLLAYPISIITGRFAKYEYKAGDIIIAILLLTPCGFVFSPRFEPLPPMLQSPYFLPHVASYMLAYIFVAKAVIAAVGRLFGKDNDRDILLFARLGFPFMAAGLILGSFWAKSAWGRYWGWDPKELWALATFLVYAGYFHFDVIAGKRFAKSKAVWVIMIAVFILCTMLWVNLSSRFSGLHSYSS